MAKNAKITLHPSFEIGEISPRLFSGFLEPIGTMVNGTMYNPAHPTADEQGFRKDVMEALKKGGIPAIRLPGGNFVSCWDWQDSIGPKEERKTRLDLSWFQIYKNEVGHDEYLQWAEKVGFEPMYTINLGTGDINDAMKIIEYSNHPGGTYYSDLRAKNGHADPYKVKIWCLGNEMDGPWQLGAWEKNPKGYGILVHEVSKAMKFVDGSIETVACVSSSPFLAHYPQWDFDVLEQCYETVDYISLHHYHSAPEGDLGAWLAGSDMFEDYIRTEVALCDFMKTKLRSTKTMMISFDEYGSNPHKVQDIHYGRNGKLLVDEIYKFDPNRQYVYHDPTKPRMGGMFNRGGEMLRVLTTFSLTLTFVRHADRVKIACMTGGIGALAASDYDHVWKSASYYPYTQLIEHCKGTSIMPEVESETYDVPGYATCDFFQYDTHNGIKYIEAAAAKNDDELAVFVINRDWNDDANLTLDVEAFEGYEFKEHVQLYTDDLDARNTYENPEALIPSVNENVKFENGTLSAEVKKLSWNMFLFKKI